MSTFRFNSFDRLFLKTKTQTAIVNGATRLYYDIDIPIFAVINTVFHVSQQQSDTVYSSMPN